MKTPERDNLLIRLDEQTKSIFRELVSLNEHQVEQNGSIQKALERSTSNKTWITALRWSALIIATAIGATKGAGVW